MAGASPTQTTRSVLGGGRSQWKIRSSTPENDAGEGQGNVFCLPCLQGQARVVERGTLP